jgi:hypothetical protein
MRKFLIILLSSTISLSAIYALYLYMSHSQEEDSLVIALRDDSFFPINFIKFNIFEPILPAPPPT